VAIRTNRKVVASIYLADKGQFGINEAISGARIQELAISLGKDYDQLSSMQIKKRHSFLNTLTYDMPSHTKSNEAMFPASAYYDCEKGGAEETHDSFN